MKVDNATKGDDVGLRTAPSAVHSTAEERAQSPTKAAPPLKSALTTPTCGVSLFTGKVEPGDATSFDIGSLPAGSGGLRIRRAPARLARDCLQRGGHSRKSCSSRTSPYPDHFSRGESHRGSTGAVKPLPRLLRERRGAPTRSYAETAPSSFVSGSPLYVSDLKSFLYPTE